MIVTTMLFAFALSASKVDSGFEVCRNKLKQAQQMDLLQALDWKAPQEPRVVVGPTFDKIPIDAKEGFIETVNCFLMAGEAGKCVNFDVLDGRTGKAVGRFKNCHYRSN